MFWDKHAKRIFSKVDFYDDNDDAGGWGGYDSPGYSGGQDNPSDPMGGTNDGHNDYSNIFEGILYPS